MTLPVGDWMARAKTDPSAADLSPIRNFVARRLLVSGTQLSRISGMGQRLRCAEGITARLWHRRGGDDSGRPVGTGMCQGEG
jgi:hypothetical protein